MSKKNTLEAKRQRKANKQKDRGYPEFYTVVVGDKYTKLTTPKQDKKQDQLRTLIAGVYMNNFLSALGLNKPEVLEGEVV